MINIVFEEDKNRAAAYSAPEDPVASVVDAAKKVVEKYQEVKKAAESGTSVAATKSFGDGAACSIAWNKDPAIGQCTFVSEVIDGKTVWTIDHTLVDDEFGGQGIAGKLVAAVVAEAKARGALIKPVCSYAVRQFEKKPEYQEIEYK